jgi:hypothetical protein
MPKPTHPEHPPKPEHPAHPAHPGKPDVPVLLPDLPEPSQALQHRSQELEMAVANDFVYDGQRQDAEFLYVRGHRPTYFRNGASNFVLTGRNVDLVYKIPIDTYEDALAAEIASGTGTREQKRKRAILACLANIDPETD